MRDQGSKEWFQYDSGWCDAGGTLEWRLSQWAVWHIPGRVFSNLADQIMPICANKPRHANDSDSDSEYINPMYSIYVT